MGEHNKLNIALFFYFEPNEFDGAASAAIYDEIEVDWKIDVVCFASVCAPEKLVMGRYYEIINSRLAGRIAELKKMYQDVGEQNLNDQI